MRNNNMVAVADSKATASSVMAAIAGQDVVHPQFSLSDWMVLPVIVFSQFACSSIWFAPNAVISQVDNFEHSQVSALVSCVQAGFVTGTLILTYLTLTDRVSPPLLFGSMALLGAGLNGLCITTTNFAIWATLRVLIGVCLAGVYPVGMKIAATQYPTGLGARLGILVGALTLGTAFPWLVRGIGDEAGLPFAYTLGTVSMLGVTGAIIMVLTMVPRMGGPGSETLRRAFSCCFVNHECSMSDEGGDVSEVGEEFGDKRAEEDHDAEENADIGEKPGKIVSHSGSSSVKNGREQTDPLDDNDDAGRSNCDSLPTALTGLVAFKAIVVSSEFRAAAIGYFGHMWELYGFYTHVPSLINSHSLEHGVLLGNEALTAFATIGIGAISCSVAGIWSLYAGRGVYPGSAVVAIACLTISLLCCLIVPTYQSMNQGFFLFFLLVWGSTVVADSAQFSSLAAVYAYPGLVGTALTLTTSIGFAITIVSIQLLGALIDSGWDPGYAMALLGIGPAIGVYRAYREWPLHRLCCRATVVHQVDPQWQNLETNWQEVDDPSSRLRESRRDWIKLERGTAYCFCSHNIFGSKD